jgi:hypothetical protein
LKLSSDTHNHNCVVDKDEDEGEDDEEGEESKDATQAVW